MSEQYVITLRTEARALAERLRHAGHMGYEPQPDETLALLIQILDILVAEEQEEQERCPLFGHTQEQ